LFLQDPFQYYPLTYILVFLVVSFLLAFPPKPAGVKYFIVQIIPIYFIWIV
jgi:hypothetical protein